LLIVGVPRFDELMAAELGVDRIFGRGTTPREVASYLVHALIGPSDHPAATLNRTEGQP
jgi:beta-lysine 5,6-aminomutase beta subunit